MKALPEVAEAVALLEDIRLRAEERELNPWGLLTPKLYQWVEDEIGRCRQDFAYFAGNYIYLRQTKSSQRMLMNLNDAQELILDTILNEWKKGKAAWIMIHKSRQVGASTLWQALFAWKTVFYRQQVGMIIAHSSEHAVYTFQTIQYMIFNLPWWMQPHIASLLERQSINFGRGKDGSREGLENFLLCNGCNRLSAFGQGKPIHNCALTECSHYKPSGKAREIIEGDLKSAVVFRPGCFWIMESKPAGIGGYWYKCWKHYSELGRKAQFIPVFIPVFFERNRRVKPPDTFRANREEIEMRERYSHEWSTCKQCKRLVYKNNQDDAACLACGSLETDPVVLDNQQIAWYRWRYHQAKSTNDKESLKLFKQEMAWTPEMGFQAHGLMMFPDDVYSYAQETAIPPKFIGEYLDDMKFHPKAPRCPVCKGDHEFDERFNLWVWEHPVPGAIYGIGVDVAYGGDDGDFSVICIQRCGSFSDPDTQAAEWSGKISAGELARVIYILAKVYNDAQVAIEAHGIGDTTQFALVQMGYTHLWRWKHYDSVHMHSQKLGWWTNYQSKQRLIAHFISWMRRKITRVYSTRVLHEMPTFTKEFEEDLTGQAVRGAHDDHLMAYLISSFTLHDEHWDADKGRVVIPGGLHANPMAGALGPKVWAWECPRCGEACRTADPRAAWCEKCGGEGKNVPIIKTQDGLMKFDHPSFGDPGPGSREGVESKVASFMEW